MVVVKNSAFLVKCTSTKLIYILTIAALLSLNVRTRIDKDASAATLDLLNCVHKC